ncbi:MAG: hypothetical protein KG003_08030 [Bacteroidetes bacterium]|nr:hypothetical protein [Bacteroidota bacterium]
MVDKIAKIDKKDEIDSQSIQNIENLIKVVLFTGKYLKFRIEYHRIEDTRDYFIFTLFRNEKPWRVIGGVSETLYYFLGAYEQEYNETVDVNSLKKRMDNYSLNHQINWSSEKVFY